MSAEAAIQDLADAVREQNYELSRLVEWLRGVHERAEERDATHLRFQHPADYPPINEEET